MFLIYLWDLFGLQQSAVRQIVYKCGETQYHCYSDQNWLTNDYRSHHEETQYNFLETQQSFPTLAMV